MGEKRNQIPIIIIDKYPQNPTYFSITFIL